MSAQKSADVFFAGIPLIATLTLAQIHTIVGILGGVLGIAYLIWKWRKESLEK
jgi:hypothetical protein